ncbi:SRPBCC domain-containing protein [Salibacteraceae bacterium]|nr:polyketide cyclase/dehydrase [Crocinitomicaceae bacterium]MCH9822218.1 SRPBCC domain-containing protein [Bacteroidota bacterium]MDA7730234.1 SRPBCC domain-containing protein [Salibacteraceae bacterium]MDC1203911.1 SRPBCC domain-containing protein [Salibacteraceae bacterium]|tara:strand:+ start:4357 stop:4800 length:444 start_codon:yes stop_codon:yes gene_type:complete
MAQGKKEINTQIIINASTAAVWSVLIDNENYEKWNPLIVKSEGKIELGKRIKNTMNNGGKTMVFKPEIKELDTNKLFGWLGHLLIPGIFDGHHVFELQKISENETLFIQRERFSGILSGLILKSIRKETTDSFEAMNEALRKEAESN